MNGPTSFSPGGSRQTIQEDFLTEAVIGLSRPQKTLPCRFLYDEQGSILFNQICRLEEYYPTRTENRILADNIDEIADLIGPKCRLVEFGSGNSTKTRHLLGKLPSLSGYIPIDISGAQLMRSAAQLARDFPGLEIIPVQGDYAAVLELPTPKLRPRRTVAFFPGSTIGNFEPVAAAGFLRQIAALCGRDGGLLIGIDRKKDERTLESAYNDRQGITARFNLNVLARANRELGADFDLRAFRHRAPYNEIQSRIEMHLVSQRPQVVHLDSHEFAFEAGEYIVTEFSYKYTLPGFAGLALKAGFELVRSWDDSNHWFSVLFLRVRAPQSVTEDSSGLPRAA